MVHPGILRKQQAEADQTDADKVLSEGPISLLVVYFLDLLAGFGKLFINMTKDFRMSGSKFVYDMIYKDGTRVIPSAEKYGTIINLKPLRIILCIMYPPLGVFLSRGIYGIHYAIIAFILTYINVLFGICFALVITHIPYYADKFSQYDYYRLLTIRQLISNCRNIPIGSNYDIKPLAIFMGSISLMILILYIFIKYV